MHTPGPSRQTASAKNQSELEAEPRNRRQARENPETSRCQERENRVTGFWTQEFSGTNRCRGEAFMQATYTVPLYEQIKLGGN